MLFGSSYLPSTIYIAGREYTLGDIVRRAFTDSGLSSEGWNNQKPVERDIRLVKALHAIDEETSG